MTYLTSKAGEFRATCRKGEWLGIQQFPAHDYDLSALPSRWDMKRGEEVYAVPCALDTSDRAEYLAHMAEVHGKKPFHRMVMTIPVRLWKSPKAPTEHRVLVTKADVEVCDCCGLVAEIDGSAATELWWTEHQRGCALAVEHAHQAAS